MTTKRLYALEYFNGKHVAVYLSGNVVIDREEIDRITFNKLVEENAGRWVKTDYYDGVYYHEYGETK